MGNVETYIEMLEDAIYSRIIHQNANGIDPAVERDLHVLFENRKHAQRYLEEIRKE